MDNSNVTSTYPIGVWCIDENNTNMAIRFTDDKSVRIPISTEILEEIKRQIEANKLFRVFQKVSIEDENIIGYLNLILSDYVNFLDKDNLNRLIAKMKKIQESNQIDNQNTFYIENLSTYLKNNNMESFDETLEEFQSYNQNYFDNAFSNEENNRKH